ncbi:hypothetical protein O181_112400 [Austropuccinia psidii MF-1]|uniref:Uncharacterized protein n=1 Tax=Austropuccinia psidii MF-1 TaxID=1389203 RepID=A0A9Q3K0E8_9BASI|nr:hypothetical protein [Austropuccinia psidii MF-1]
MIKWPTHSPITASKMSNWAIIMLEGELALTHPPSRMHTLTHPPPHMHTHTPMQLHCTCGIVWPALPVSSAK